MNKQNFQQTGGFPLETDNLDAMQTAYSLFNAYGYLAGATTAIISGCTQTGTTVANGTVFINGELFEFRGGTAQASVRIIEETTDKQFEDGNTKTVYHKRYVTFATGIGSMPWANFVRPLTMVQLQRAITPIGLISMWSGSVTALPTGWQLCDGTNNNPDLRGRFIVGLNPADADYNAIGKTGGAKEVALTQAQLPIHTHSGSTSSDGSHTHVVRDAYWAERNNSSATIDGRESIGKDVYGSGDSDSDNNWLYYKNRITDPAGAHQHTLNINPIGGNAAHENRPPYYTLAFIIYKG